MKRRAFIQNATMAAAGTMLAPSVVSMANSIKGPVGIQLYTLKDVIRNDVKGTLQKVAEIGFKELEVWDYSDGKIFSMPYGDFNKMANDLGLTIVSGHYSTGLEPPPKNGSLSLDWNRAVEDAASIGQKYLVIASMGARERNTLDGYKKTCALMNRSHEICKKAGVSLGYHNHEYEFIPIEGRIPYEVMMEELDPSIVFELDIYWSTFAKKDPLELFKKYSGRIHLWHVKDMDREKRERQTDVGSGSIDYKSVFNAAEVSGMKHFFLEQEYFAGSQFDSIANGFKYLREVV
ncbi:MAG: sugar phosphate isomerase/epimerase [Cyclobacteriaceae bacterium]|nr:sugar phosphate isomerase/epimerase [Cyclobacteriaceae bacterium]